MASQLILALEWKDASRDYLDVLAATFDHPSYLELDNNSQVNRCSLAMFVAGTSRLSRVAVVHALGLQVPYLART